MAIAKNIIYMIEKSSWIRKMFEKGISLKNKFGADKVYDFSLGNPNISPPEKFKEELKKIINADISRKHSYMPNSGYPEVRDKVASYIGREQGIDILKDNIIMTCGAGGGLNVALKTIINPGDIILSSTPCFMEYAFYTQNHGGSFQTVKGAFNFDIDIDAIKSNITSQTAGVIINSPNNPSGKVFPESTIKALGEMLEYKSKEIGRAIYLISDEPYRKIVYDNVTIPSVFKFYKNSILVTSYSKDLSIPGERIGFAAIHPEADDLKNLINGMILCNRILGYVNAPALMQRTIANLQGISVDINKYKKKRDMLCKGLSDIGYEFAVPQGTFYLFPKAPGGDDLKFVDILQNELILAVPGSGFSTPGYFRIAYCVEDNVIEHSMDGFARAFKAVY